MKARTGKKAGQQLRHAPLGAEIEQKTAAATGKLRPPKPDGGRGGDDMDDEYDDVPDDMEAKIFDQARAQRQEQSGPADTNSRQSAPVGKQAWRKGVPTFDSDSEDEDNDSMQDGSDDEDGLVEVSDGYVAGSSDLTEAEEALVDKFLQSNRSESRTLADIIMDKLQEKRDGVQAQDQLEAEQGNEIPPKVVEVYTAVGKMLAHYRSGKLPKALKMLPHLKNWENVLWLTRPDEWSPAATYASTRIFASNLNEKMAQRFMNLVLLEKCRDDIRKNRKLNYYYYLAIRKALYKPSAFYKGFLLPLAQSGTCTLREATIIGSALSKLSIPGIHSAAVLLRLAELTYSGSTSMFIKILLNKKYALPRRVIDALLKHFLSFEKETRVLPVIWHQSLLVFVQRYKFEFTQGQKERLKTLSKMQPHHQISSEIGRELLTDKR